MEIRSGKSSFLIPWGVMSLAAFCVSMTSAHGELQFTCMFLLSINPSEEGCWSLTPHRNIHSQRYPIPDVPVVYLVEPNEANIQAITRDLSHGLYSPAHVNFLSSVPRPLLEDFASQIATSGASEHIAQVFDQYLNFIVAEPDLFSLGLGNNAYHKINSPKTTDEDLDAIVDKVVSGLFSVSVTMGMFRPISAS